MSESDGTVSIALSISSRPGNPAEHHGTYQATALAVEDLNDDPTIPYDVTLQIFDDHGDLARTAECADRIVEDEEILAVVGPSGSSEALVNAPIFAEAGMAQISMCASHPDLCHSGNQTFFLMVPTARTNGFVVAQFATEYVGANEIAVVRASSDWAKTASSNFIDGVTRRDRNVTAVHTYSSVDALTNGSFDGPFAEIADQEVELVVFFEHTGEEGDALSKGLRSRGVDAPFLGLNAFEPGIPGGTGDQSVYQTHPGADYFVAESAMAFRKRFERAYDPDSAYTPESYDAVMLIGDALKAIDTPSREAIRSHIQSVSFNGASGEVSFDATGERAKPVINFYELFDRDGERALDHLGTADDLLR